MKYLLRFGKTNFYNVLLSGLICFTFLKQIVGHNIHRTGIYSGIMSEYNMVAPKKVHSDGVETDITMQENHRRTKREITGDEKLQIRLPILGNNETLELWPSNGFISDSLKVQIKKYNNLSIHSSARSNMCHYRGVVRGHRESSVAISVCKGLVGYMKTSYGEFWIEPSKDGENVKNNGTHLLFRRDAVSQLLSKQQKKKRKKKYDQLCGTREPPRIVQSHLEWNQKPGWLRVQGRDHRRSHHNHFYSNKRRIGRSISKERHVETLVVADSSMIDFYTGEDIEVYLLSIMNMVSVMYQDPSIGNYINIVVVRIVLLEDDYQQGLNITVNADRTLDSFCRWQNTLNKPHDTDPQHHDVAILITRQDICSGADTPCSTLGVANVAGMCKPDRSCSVNEDNGITLAHTIAHELGHNFGMYHDSKKIGCPGRHGSTLHVMTPSFEADTLHIAWSACSRKDITNFLDSELGSCLDDKPSIQLPLAYPELPVGVMYNAEYQCKLQFGVDNSSICIPLEEVCSRLWCLVDNVCTTLLYPAAPGTSCGKHKWCEQQKCVGMEDKMEISVDGGWGKWSEWSECSRTCGAGVSITKRLCDHPPPSNGGKYCLGQRMRYRICNVQDCPETSVSFRAEQCSSFNNKTFGEKHQITWLPYFEMTEPCQLYCTDKDDTTIMPMGVSALDGTPCNLGTRDMCISGLCRKVGCNWVVDSDAAVDKCGVCKGDGSQCITVIGYYNKTHGSGYTELMTVPKNARNVYVEELGNSKNYISVGSTYTNSFYLNGNKAITLPGEYIIAESEALYTRQKEKEKLHILGPIREQIQIYLIFQGNYKNPGVRYEYTMPHLNESNNSNYEWVLSDWSACSVTCGGGVQYVSAVCKDKSTGIADTTQCSSENRPPKNMRVCNLQLCTHSWWTGPWQLCPVTCGDLALRSRTVLCVSNDDHQIALPDSDCEDQPKPHHKEPCLNTPSCLSALYSSNNVSRTLVNTNQSKKNKLNFRANFEQKSKGKWIVLPWSQCSITCGLGFKKRTVYCPKFELCETKSKPVEMKQCFNRC